MPSYVLHAQILHSLLFPDQPLYFLPPRVFSCTCFVHILTPGQDKLSCKATKCIFLGYSQLQKGYHCYSPQTHRYFLSVDVTFFEGSPFFSSSSLFLLLKSYPFPSSPHLYLMMYLLVHFRFIIIVTVPLFLSHFLRPLLTYFLSVPPLLPRLCLLLITCPLLFRKVIALLAILILFTIF